MPEKKKSSPWFSIENKAQIPEINIYDDIGGGFFSDGLTVKAFKKQLDALNGPANLDIHINSNGGEVFQGFAIYELLKNHKAHKRVFIDGIAASIASVIAQAGNEIIMAENAFQMIHQTRGLAFGNSKEMRKGADLLDKLTEKIIDTYANKAKVSREEIASMVDEETWLDAKDAIEKGFADSSTDGVKIAAFMGNRYENFKNIPVNLLAIMNCDDEDVDEEKIEVTEEPKEKEMTKEEIEAIIAGAIAPLQTELSTAKESAAQAKLDADKYKKDLEDYKVSNATVQVNKTVQDATRRLNACVNQNRITPVERDSALNLINSISDDTKIEEYVKSVESRQLIQNGMLSVEIITDQGQSKSCVIDKNFSAPKMNSAGGVKLPRAEDVAIFDQLNSTAGDDYDKFRKAAYALHGERCPSLPQVSLSQVPTA